MKLCAFFSIVTVFLFLTLRGFLLAQEEPADFYFFGDDEIEVSSEQNDRLYEIEEKLANDLESTREKLEDLKSVYQNKLAIFEAARLDLLTPNQKAELQKKRRERIERESIDQHSRDIEFLTTFLTVLREIQNMQSLEILEGPQRSDDGTIPAPKSEEPVVRVDTHWFHSEPLVIEADDSVTLASTIRNYKSFAAYAGGKFCGGFHPDANIRIRTRGGNVLILVCFGCAEARIIAKDIDIMAELETDAYSTLRTVCYRAFRRHEVVRRPQQN